MIERYAIIPGPAVSRRTLRLYMNPATRCGFFAIPITRSPLKPIIDSPPIPINVLFSFRSAFSCDSDHFCPVGVKGDRDGRTVIGMKGEQGDRWCRTSPRMTADSEGWRSRIRRDGDQQSELKPIGITAGVRNTDRHGIGTAAQGSRGGGLHW